MTIVGQFRNRHRPDRFVWIGGFADMQRRHAALEQFYTGSVWGTHRAPANATMIDFNDVRLLKPAKMARNASPLRGDNQGQDESLRVTRTIQAQKARGLGTCNRRAVSS